MSNYKSDKTFTKMVHEKLAIPLIYDKLNWKEQELKDKVSFNMDILNAIDAFFIEFEKNRIITVQERFRESKYSSYNDFTIRYKREYSKFEERKLSEFFKLDADYFVYGIINTPKENVNSANQFIKYAVIDIKGIKDLIDKGEIVFNDKATGYTCKVVNNKMICPIIQNFDLSSSFVPIDIKILNIMYPKNNIVIVQKGFF
jgi:hypothetical protein